jgi:hypothetical protein
MPILTWAESTRQLLDVILGGNWHRTVRPGGAQGGGEATRALVAAGKGQPMATPAASDDQELVVSASGG